MVISQVNCIILLLSLLVLSMCWHLPMNCSPVRGKLASLLYWSTETQEDLSASFINSGVFNKIYQSDFVRLFADEPDKNMLSGYACAQILVELHRCWAYCLLYYMLPCFSRFIIPRLTLLHVSQCLFCNILFVPYPIICMSCNIFSFLTAFVLCVTEFVSYLTLYF